MSLIYRFNFDTRYHGRSVAITDAGGTPVAGSPFTLDEAGDYALSIDTPGTYTGKVSNPAVYAGDGFSVAEGVLDTPASIASGGGGGHPTADTAFLIATARPGVTDGNPFTIDLAWDNRDLDLYPHVPWLTDNLDGTFTVDDGAGDVAFGGIGNVSIDFTEASAIPDDPGYINSQIRIKVDGDPVVAVTSADIPADGQDVQATGAFGPTFGASRVDVAPGAVLVAEVNWVNARDTDGVTDILDAATTVTFAVAINRGVSAPTLP